MYGYVYITENLINGKKYIGQHRARNTEDDSYLGSGVNISRAIKKYGAKNFTRQIVCIADSKEELNVLTIATIAEHNAIRNFGYTGTVEYLRQIGVKTRQRWQEMTADERTKMCDCIRLGQLGRPKTNVAKLGVSNWTPEAIANMVAKRKAQVAAGIGVPPPGNRGNKDFRHNDESRHKIRIGVRQARERVAAERGAYLSGDALIAMREKVTRHYTPDVKRTHAHLIREGQARRLAEYKEQGIEPPKFRWFHNPLNPKQRLRISDAQRVPRGWIAGKGKTGGRKVSVEQVHELIDAGWKNAEIAREVKCSTTQIRNIRNAKYEDEIKSKRPNPYD